VSRPSWGAFSQVAGQLWVTSLWTGLLLIIYRSRPDTDASEGADSTRHYRRFLATYSRALLVLVTLVNVSLLLAALRDWQVYRLSGIGAALPVLPVAAGLLILVTVGVRMPSAGMSGPSASMPGMPATPPVAVNVFGQLGAEEAAIIRQALDRQASNSIAEGK
jgi:hypothetical protein